MSLANSVTGIGDMLTLLSSILLSCLGLLALMRMPDKIAKIFQLWDIITQYISDNPIWGIIQRNIGDIGLFAIIISMILMIIFLGAYIPTTIHH